MYVIPKVCPNSEALALKTPSTGTSLVVQWLRLRILNAGGPGFDPWSGNWIPHATAKDPVCWNKDPVQANK